MGFTIIEILLVVGIIGSLSSVTILSVNPQKQLRDARDRTRDSAIKTIGDAVSQSMIEGRTYSGALVSNASGDETPICSGAATAGTCFNMTNLVPTYISSLPTDVLERCTGYTGYGISLDSNGRARISSLYKGISSIPSCLLDTEGRWQFGQSGNSSYVDSVNLTNSGALVNGPIWASGYKGRGLHFDGLNDMVTVNDRPTLKYAAGSLSLATWMKADAGETDGGYMVSKPWNGSGEYNYLLAYNSNNSVSFCLVSQGTWVCVVSVTAVPTGSWHHIAGVAGGGTMSIYVDGTLSASVPDPFVTLSPTVADLNLPLVIGSVYPYGQGWAGNEFASFLGTLDDVRVYKRALSPEEVAALAAGK